MTELQGHEDRLEISADSGVFVRSRAEGSHGRSRVGGSAVQHPHSAREQGATNRTHGISTQRPHRRTELRSEPIRSMPSRQSWWDCIWITKGSARGGSAPEADRDEASRFLLL